MEEVEKIFPNTKNEVVYDQQVVADLLSFKTIEEAVKYLASFNNEEFVSGSLLKAFENRSNCENLENWLNINVTSETPFDDIVIIFTEIIIGEKFFIKIPKSVLNSILDSITLIRISLKISEISKDTCEFITNNWKKIDISILKNYIAIMNTWHITDLISEYVFELEETDDFIKLSEFIWRFELYSFNINWNRFINNLVKYKMISKITTLLYYKPELMSTAISILNTPLNAKYAAKIIDSFQLNIKDYPEVIKYMEQSALNFYLRSYFTDKSDPCYMPLWKVEDLLKGADLISQNSTLIEDLIENFAKKNYRNKVKIAKALAIRNGVLVPNCPIPKLSQEEMLNYIFEHNMLESNDFVLAKGSSLSESTLYNMSYIYLSEKQLEIDSIEDRFGPISTPTDDYLLIPETTNIYFVDSDEDFGMQALTKPIIKNWQAFSFLHQNSITNIEAKGRVKILKQKEIVGIDCEWRPAVTKYHDRGAALLQIGDKNDIFLIDLIALQNSVKMDVFLKEIFTDPKISIVGMDFRNDMKEIAKRFEKTNSKNDGSHKFSFWSEITSFYDVYSIYKDIYGQKTGAKLSQIVEHVQFRLNADNY